MSLKRTFNESRNRKLGGSLSKHLIYLVLLCMFGIAITTAISKKATADAGAKQILYINAFHRGYGWSDEVENGLRDTLDASGEDINLSVVYLDTLRFQAAEIMEKIAELLTLKRVSDEVEIVITSDNAAIDFVLDQNDSLFRNQTIVYTALSDFSLESLTASKNITGISEYTDYQQAIDLALKLHPKTTSLVFIGATNEKHNSRIIDIVKSNVIPKYGTQLDTELVTNKSIDELDAILSQFPSNTIIFALSNTLPKKNGGTFSPAETARLLASITPFPVYTFWHSHIGHGAVGGQIVTGYSQGKAAAQLALDILRQDTHAPLPSAQSTPSSLFFDLEAIDKHNIDKTLLPEGTRFINFQPPIWQEYKNEVLVALVIIFALVSVVLAFTLLTKRQSETIHQIHDENVELNQALDINQEALEDITHQFSEVNPFDELTGLSNYRHFNDMLEKELRRASRYKTPLSLILISVDKFDGYKRSNGQESAYELLSTVGTMLSGTCQRSSDVLAHLLDEKFAIILPHTTRDNAQIVCQKLHSNLLEMKLPFVLSTSGSVTISLGLSSLEGSDSLVTAKAMFNSSEAMRVTSAQRGGNATCSEVVNSKGATSPLRGA